MPQRRPSPEIPVIDLFAGPGGLGEGLSSFVASNGKVPFAINLSIEKDQVAHQTLHLRAFFRTYPAGEAPVEYYELLRGNCTRDDLFGAFPEQAAIARDQAWCQELGPSSREVVKQRIQAALRGADRWVLIGGPPCQAYSLVGRARNRGVVGYAFESDTRSTLYVEYLRVIADHWPAAFVMENVKGILSAQLQGDKLFGRILSDLADPARALKRAARRGFQYDLHSVADNGALIPATAADFVVRSEHYGVPQARHRVVIVGIRSDIRRPPGRLTRTVSVPAGAVLNDLPRLRSGLSRSADDPAAWLAAVGSMRGRALRAIAAYDGDVAQRIVDSLSDLKPPRADRGGSFVRSRRAVRYRPDWFGDALLDGICNHSTRGHMVPDLHRYLYAACYAAEHARSPALRDFPPALLPDHRNVGQAVAGGMFGDRFRVQLPGQPSTTITSHIGKDGHYYIHPDAGQCRSLTVREAARLQTFPDNYLFCGPRTAQYAQVGNAVPPLLAAQIAAAVYSAIS